jgi:glycosyltransferase involved in cell wall biosynthesis
MLGSRGLIPNAMEGLVPFLEARGFACTLISPVLNPYARLVDTSIRLLRSLTDFDLVSLQVFGGRSFVVEEVASYLTRRAGRPLQMVLHGGGFPQSLQRHSRIGHRVLNRADQVVTPSRFLAESVRKHGYDSRVIPNAIDVSQYAFKLRAVPAPRVLWMRAFHEIYNPELALRAFASIKTEYPDASLTMAGPDKGVAERTRSRALDLGLQESVTFEGFLDPDAKRAAFLNHDLFLNTNRVDNTPITLIEAAASGLPIVATSVGGIPYMVEDEVTALLVGDDDDARLAAAMKRILKEPGLAERLSKNGRMMAEKWDFSQTVPLWEEAFASALGRI